MESSHLIENTAERPDVTFPIVRQIGPYFRTSIVWSTSLSDCESAFTDLRNIQICQLSLFMILCEKNVSSFDVPVENVHAMEYFEAVEHLDSHSPYDYFPYRLFLFLMGLDERS